MEHRVVRAWMYLRISLIYLDRTKIRYGKIRTLQIDATYVNQMILITFWFLILDFLILQFELHICPVLSCFRSTLLFALNSFGILALSNSRSSLIFYLEPPFYSTLIPNSTSFYSLSFFSTFFPFWVHDFSFFILYIESLISSFQFTWILNFPPFCEFHRVSQVLLSISNSILFRIHNFWNLILLLLL